MKYSIYLLMLLVSLPCSAEIVDELAISAGVNNTSNRSMRESGNLNQIQNAFDTSDPRENVKRYQYDANSIYKIRMREYMNTTVVLPIGETIVAESLGDKKNFEFVPLTKEEGMLSNIFDITNLYPGADTNLNVVGKSGNIYSFYLRVDSVKSKYMPHFVTYIDDDNIDLKMAITNKSNVTLSTKSDNVDYLNSLPLVDPSKIYYSYKIDNGPKNLKPIRVFDDGYWTYFQYDDKNFNKTAVPAIYKVVDGYDTPINNRIVNGTVIAETTGNAFTIRSGESYLCVRRISDDSIGRTANSD